MWFTLGSISPLDSAVYHHSVVQAQTTHTGSPYVPKRTWTHHVSPVQPAEYISMPRGPKGLHCDCCWGQGSWCHPSGEESESAFCCTAERWVPVWRRSPACCNCRGVGAPGEGLASGFWGAPSCRPPGPWCTLAGWHSHEPAGSRRLNSWQSGYLLTTATVDCYYAGVPVQKLYFSSSL